MSVFQAVNAWEAWEVRKTLTKVAKVLYEQSRGYAKEYLRRVVQKYMRMENTGFTVFDPKNGEIRAAIFLPLEVKQLNKMPAVDMRSLQTALMKLKEKYIPASDYSIWDTYYKYKPSSNVLDWIPPFKGEHKKGKKESWGYTLWSA